jgi:wyosine [tRNA(Phe)-imidazoG37] synthetase (radical SAM superfamily)
VRKNEFKYIYGPVASWRLGVSLGIDLLSPTQKVCNFDCIYCQLGRNLKFTKNPEVYVKTEEIIKELNRLPKIKLDYITFSGRGEPSLARNLGEAIKAVKELDIVPVAILTNASLINRADIRKSLHLADFVIVKLDTYSQESLVRINRPEKTIRFDKILQGIKQFKKSFKGKFALQMMFVKSNQKDVKKLARLATEINPDEVQINTPLRPCKVRPLSKKDIETIKNNFLGLNFVSVYDVHPRELIPLTKKGTMRRRGEISVV